MKSAQLGKPISPVEVTNVSKLGFWLLIDGSEKFLAFDKFRWFQDATISQIMNVELPSLHHLYWPDLNIDLAVESIDHPEQFPLVSKVRPNSPSQRMRKKQARG
jgi:hypothetical protein